MEFVGTIWPEQFHFFLENTVLFVSFSLAFRMKNFIFIFSNVGCYWCGKYFIETREQGLRSLLWSFRLITLSCS